MPPFTFGENWRSYAQGISEQVIAQAMTSLVHLLGEAAIRGKTVIDVGCGSGLFTLAFVRLGAAQVYALDVDSQCVQLTQQLLDQEPDGQRAAVLQLSILDPAIHQHLPRVDVIYAWGALHHTGAMWRALEHTTSLLLPGGLLAVALYNRHWTSPLWRWVKRLYNSCPSTMQAGLVRGYFYLGQIYNAMTRRQVALQRGMEVMHDIRDWLGGLPYEYASPDEVQAFAKRQAWHMVRMIPCQGMTGCNEFVLRRPAPCDTHAAV
jgi:2-polyprenyl-6-hydroxyphenyl methylase/3-demethylubiquinone-9 3-methyltransferase